MLLPGMTLANGFMPKSYVQIDSKGLNGQHQHLHHKNDHNFQEKMNEKEQNLVTLVKQYTPDQIDEWTKVIEERKNLREKWLSPEYSEKRAQWKKEKIGKIQELKEQYDAGKITKEDFIKYAHGGKELDWKMYHSLMKAVENSNDKQVTLLLNKMLAQYKQHNKLLKSAINIE